MHNRPFSFLITVILLTGIGIIAGVNLIIQSEPKPGTSLSTEKTIVAKQNNPDSGMITQGTFVSATSSGELGAQTETSVSTTAQKQVTAYAYLVGDVSTGKIYTSLNSMRALPVASMSKLMTAIVATNQFTPTTTIEIPELSADIATDTSNLQTGEKFSLEEILRPLLLSSSNVAAEAIASTRTVSTTSTSTVRLNFLELMSNTAWEIGMPKTYFADPSGLDSHNQASAQDIFVLAQYLYTSRPDILKITRTAHTEIATTSTHGGHEIDSTHPFVMDPRFIGGKTGRTYEAGETMLTILNINDKPIAFIVLHSKYGYRASDTNILIKKYVDSLHN